MCHNDLILMKSQNKNASSHWPFSLANIIHFQVKDSMIFDLVVVWTTGSCPQTRIRLKTIPNPASFNPLSLHWQGHSWFHLLI